MKYKIKNLLIGQQIIDNTSLDYDIEISTGQSIDFNIIFENRRRYHIMGEIFLVEEVNK